MIIITTSMLVCPECCYQHETLDQRDACVESHENETEETS